MQSISQATPITHSATRGVVRPVLVSAVFFMAVTGLAYPLATTGVARLLFPAQAEGSLVSVNGQVVGSGVIGQYFTKPEYFHSRPSVTTGADPADPSKTIDQPFNAASSAASNQGVLSKKLLDAVTARAQAYREENALAADAAIPVDAVTASASGLDPDISVANAKLQAARVANARGVAVEDLLKLVDQSTTAPQLGLLGDPRVNVLKLNLALDQAFSARPAAQ